MPPPSPSLSSLPVPRHLPRQQRSSAPAARRLPRQLFAAAAAAAAPSADYRTRAPADVRVLVVGATGYVGKFVVKELVKRGYNVVAFARERSGIGGKQSAEDVKKELAGAGREGRRERSGGGVCRGVKERQCCSDRLAAGRGSAAAAGRLAVLGPPAAVAGKGFWRAPPPPPPT